MGQAVWLGRFTIQTVCRWEIEESDRETACHLLCIKQHDAYLAPTLLKELLIINTKLMHDFL